MASAELTVLDKSKNDHFGYTFAMAKGNGADRPNWFLREHIANQRTSITALAKRLNTSYQTVWRYQNASRQPKRETEAQIERAMNLPTNALRRHPDDSGEQAFLAGMSEKSREVVKSIAQFQRQKDEEEERKH